MHRLLWGVLLLIVVGLPATAVAEDNLPDCNDRPTRLFFPEVDYGRWCVELVIHDKDSGIMGFTQLVATPDGDVFATRPTAGQVIHLTDQDGDGLPEQAEVVLEGLVLPNGLDYHEGALYVVAGPAIVRLDDDGTQTTLVDDLPVGTGFWNSGLIVGPDDRIYVGTGAPCDVCEVDNPERGAILSFDLDGGDRELVATGLRNPADLAFHKGELWVVDTARDGLANNTLDGGPVLDEINRVERGAFFGFPYCVGVQNLRDWGDGEFDCSTTTPPTVRLQTGSAPLGMASYTSGTFPGLTGSLLVAIGGQTFGLSQRGYQVAAVHMSDGFVPIAVEELIPYSRNWGGTGIIPYSINRTHGGYRPKTTYLTSNLDGKGIWPNHPYDITVSPEGWLYISISGGRIVALRPTGQPRR